MLSFLREGSRHRPGGGWDILIRAGSVAAALYVLWIGALAQMFGNAALLLSRELPGAVSFLQGPLAAFATWARAFTAYFHLDIAIFIAITFPIAFLTTTARPDRKRLAWTDVALAAIALAVALYYIVWNDRFLHWSRGFSQPNAADLVAGFALIALDHELVGALVVVMTRGMFNTLIPVLVLERGKSSVLSSQASYSTWRDFGAALGPLSAPWLFLNIPQAPLYAALAAALGISAYFCLVRR